MTVIFLIITISMVIYQYRREKNWVNLISLFIGPYIPLVFLNNFFIYKDGFYVISDKVLIMLLSAFILFFCGTLFFKPTHNKIVADNNYKILLQRYNFKRMTLFLSFISLCGLVKIIFMYRSGAFDASNFDDSEGIMGEGPVGHLLLMSYSVLPIYVLNIIENKKWIYFSPVFVIFLVTFCTFIKYNIIGVFVTMFIFFAIHRKDLLKRAVAGLLGFVGVAFWGNYAISFALAGNELEAKFMYGHFWKYLCGSLIYDNYIFESGVRPGIDSGYKLMTFLCALPNMFISKFFDTSFYPHIRQGENYICDFGEWSNVVDAIGYLYPSKCGFFAILFWGIAIFFIGIYFSYLYKKHIRIYDRFDMFIVVFLCYFVFFSFFGTFYVNSSPWEILVYSIFIPNIFFRYDYKH